MSVIKKKNKKLVHIKRSAIPKGGPSVERERDYRKMLMLAVFCMLSFGFLVLGVSYLYHIDLFAYNQASPIHIALSAYAGAVFIGDRLYRKFGLTLGEYAMTVAVATTLSLPFVIFVLSFVSSGK